VSIDVHNHVIPPAVLDLVGRDPAYGVTLAGSRWRSRNIGELDLVPAWYEPVAKLAEMDALGLDRAVVSVAPKPLYYYELDLAPQRQIAEVANEALADFCSHGEGRLRWMAHVPLAFPQEAASMLGDAAGSGAVAVQIGTSAAGRRLDDPAYEVVWDKVEELALPVFLHPAYEDGGPRNDRYALGVVVGMADEVTNAVYRLVCGHVFDRHPGLRVIAALGGGAFPYLAGRLRQSVTFRPELAGVAPDPWSYLGQLKFDTHVHDAATLRYLIDKAGSGNVLIGTDCSFQSHTSDPLGELREATHGDKAAFAAISDGNAEELFWGAEPGAAWQDASSARTPTP